MKSNSKNFNTSVLSIKPPIKKKNITNVRNISSISRNKSNNINKRVNINNINKKINIEPKDAKIVKSKILTNEEMNEKINNMKILNKIKNKKMKEDIIMKKYNKVDPDSLIKKIPGEPNNVTEFNDGVIGVWKVDYGKKKYKVVLYKDYNLYKKRKKMETVSFGASDYEQYEDRTPLKYYSSKNHLDIDRRESYLKRSGSQGYQNRVYSPAWFSWNFLW
jgi:hypothetical protein